MVTDPVADMLTRIRNALCARHERTLIPASRLKLRVAKILQQEGYVSDVRESEAKGRKTLTVVLKYGRDRKSIIDGIRRVSRPGRRVYVGCDEIPYVYSGLGVSILSTSKGLMTDKDARRQRIGGEVLCEVW
jgi:small subunit ribosomal protein S8